MPIDFGKRKRTPTRVEKDTKFSIIDIVGADKIRKLQDLYPVSPKVRLNSAK